MFLFLMCVAAAADPAELSIVYRAGFAPDMEAMPGTNIMVPTGTGQETERMWAEDEHGRRIPAAEFARLTGDLGEQALILEYRSEGRARTRAAMLVGAAAWAGGALVLLATHEDPNLGGLAVMLSGQVMVGWGGGVRAVRWGRTQRLEYWYDHADAARLAEQYSLNP